MTSWHKLQWEHFDNLLGNHDFMNQSEAGNFLFQSCQKCKSKISTILPIGFGFYVDFQMTLTQTISTVFLHSSICPTKQKNMSQYMNIYNYFADIVNKTFSTKSLMWRKSPYPSRTHKSYIFYLVFLWSANTLHLHTSITHYDVPTTNRQIDLINPHYIKQIGLTNFSWLNYYIKQGLLMKGHQENTLQINPIDFRNEEEKFLMVMELSSSRMLFLCSTQIAN